MTPNLDHHQPFPEDIHAEISKIHMYDSIILSKQPSPKTRMNSTLNQNKHQIQKVIRTKNSSIDIQSHYS